MHCGHRCRGVTTKRFYEYAISRWPDGEFERWRVHCPRCNDVHVEHLDWLTKNPRCYTQRFAMQVGKLCRDMPNKTVAEMERLHRSTVKDLDKLYMQKQVDLARLPAPRAIGIDDISIRKAHNYRTESGARVFFERWKNSLKWQRLEPYQKIAPYCHPENKVSLGLAEGANNKMQGLQRGAYGYRDEDYLKLKIVAAFLPLLPRNTNINPHVST